MFHKNNDYFSRKRTAFVFFLFVIYIKPKEVLILHTYILSKGWQIGCFPFRLKSSRLNLTISAIVKLKRPNVIEICMCVCLCTIKDNFVFIQLIPYVFACSMIFYIFIQNERFEIINFTLSSSCNVVFNEIKSINRVNMPVLCKIYAVWIQLCVKYKCYINYSNCHPI